MWSDWLVFCDSGFGHSALWCPLSALTVLLGFLLPGTWCISSRLFQLGAAIAPYLGREVSPLGHHSWPWTWGNSFQLLLHRADNHDGMITHLEPYILECEGKWALESITMNKASGGDGIPVELFQILKVMLWKCCTQYASKFGKLSSGHRTEQGQFSFPSQRKAMPKNAQTTTQMHSSHRLVK